MIIIGWVLESNRGWLIGWVFADLNMTVLDEQSSSMIFLI
jgi:hypothetical protein